MEPRTWTHSCQAESLEAITVAESLVQTSMGWCTSSSMPELPTGECRCAAVLSEATHQTQQRFSVRLFAIAREEDEIESFEGTWTELRSGDSIRSIVVIDSEEERAEASDDNAAIARSKPTPDSTRARISFDPRAPSFENETFASVDPAGRTADKSWRLIFLAPAPRAPILRCHSIPAIAICGSCTGSALVSSTSAVRISRGPYLVC